MWFSVCLDPGDRTFSVFSSATFLIPRQVQASSLMYFCIFCSRTGQFTVSTGEATKYTDQVYLKILSKSYCPGWKRD